MAAPIAYQQPTLNRAWEAFLAHVPAILLIWIASLVLAGVGLAVSAAIALVALALAGGGGAGEAAATLASLLGQLGQLPFSVLSSLVGVLGVAVPALYYAGGQTITPHDAFQALLRRPLRYLLAGLLFTLVTVIGLMLCVLPGLVVALVMPVYVNRVFVTDQPLPEAFSGSFQAVFRSPKGLTFLGIELLAWLLVLVVSVCTCGVGALLAVPVSTFYLQNAAYHLGVIS